MWDNIWILTECPNSWLLVCVNQAVITHLSASTCVRFFRRQSDQHWYLHSRFNMMQMKAPTSELLPAPRLHRENPPSLWLLCSLRQSLRPFRTTPQLFSCEQCLPPPGQTASCPRLSQLVCLWCSSPQQLEAEEHADWLRADDAVSCTSFLKASVPSVYFHLRNYKSKFIYESSPRLMHYIHCIFRSPRFWKSRSSYFKVSPI